MKYATSNLDIILFTPSQGARTICVDHPFFAEICRALQSGDDNKVLSLIDIKEAIAAPVQKALPQATVQVQDDGSVNLELDGLQVTGHIRDALLEAKKRGIPASALRKFWEKVQKNPLLVGKTSLLDFLAANHVPLLPNGNFLAYKGVFQTADPTKFEAAHDRSFVYVLGKPATLDRAHCTADVEDACGPGLHVGGFSHATGYGNAMLDCEVDPADVVSVPKAENCKLRACRVTPIRVHLGNVAYSVDYVDLSATPAATSTSPCGDGISTDEYASNCDREDREDDLDEEEDNGSCMSCDDNDVYGGNIMRSDAKRSSSGGRNKKTTWYRLKGKVIVSQRKAKCPGPEWSATKPTVGKQVRLPGASMRTWYRLTRNGTVERRRAAEKPFGFSSHKPSA